MTATTIDIDRSILDVYDYATDPSTFHEWQQGVVAGGMEQPGTPTVGSRCLMTRRIGGADRASTSTVTERTPPRTWSVRGIDGPIRALVDVIVEPLGDTRSRVTIAVDFQGHGIGRLLVPLVVRRGAAKEMPANLQRLKDRLEKPQPPP